ncbi:hypothetical protein GCM10028808_74600 [Spirosoma migulaei]
MTTAEVHLRAWADQAIRPVIREILRDELADLFPKLSQANPIDEVGGVALAVKITRLSEARIYTLVSKRAIPHKKRGNRLYFRQSELEAWVEQGNRKQNEEVAK